MYNNLFWEEYDRWLYKNTHFPTSYTSIHKIEYHVAKWVVTTENLTEHISSDQAAGMAN